jgi:hypothetical protein
MQGAASTIRSLLLVAAAAALAGLSPPPVAARTPKTEVKIVNGVPRIMVDGEDRIRTVNHIYYFPTFSRPDGALVNEYRRGGWLAGVKRQIDQMAGYGANTLVLQFWWIELAESRSINFDPLDQALRYAAQKGLYVILAPKVDTMPPLWWAKENDYPDPSLYMHCLPQEAGADRTCIPREICAAGDPRCCTKPREELFCCEPETQEGTRQNGPPQVVLGADGLPTCRPITTNSRYKACSACETDSYGWKYSNPGWSDARFRQDYGDFLRALVGRYREDPVLTGWLLSLGPTGEDTYGPSYVILRMVLGDMFGSSRSDQVMDYSDSAQRSFRVWIRGRYRSDDELRKAWGDPGLSLQTVQLPDPRRLFKDGRAAQFPDDFFVGFFVELDALSPQGRDLYDFREAVRDEVRSSFTRLVKEADREHVLIYNGTNNEGVFNDPFIDAVQGNNHVEYALNGTEEAGTLGVVTAMNVKRGKASSFGIESVGDHGGLRPGAPGEDRSGQKSALKHAAETILCSGGYFGYTSDISEPGGFLPTWNIEDKEVLKDIAMFKPTKECICKLVSPNQKVANRRTVAELVDRFGLQGQYPCPRVGVTSGAHPQQPSSPGGGQGHPYCGDGLCDDFEKTNPSLCPRDCGGGAAGSRTAAPPSTTKGQGQPSCGDGMCDDFEKSSGICPLDCGGASSRTP